MICKIKDWEDNKRFHPLPPQKKQKNTRSQGENEHRRCLLTGINDSLVQRWLHDKCHLIWVPSDEQIALLNSSQWIYLYWGFLLNIPAIFTTKNTIMLLYESFKGNKHTYTNVCHDITLSFMFGAWPAWLPPVHSRKNLSSVILK